MVHIKKKKIERKRQGRKERLRGRKEGRKPAPGCLSAAGKITAPPLPTMRKYCPS